MKLFTKKATKQNNVKDLLQAPPGQNGKMTDEKIKAQKDAQEYREALHLFVDLEHRFTLLKHGLVTQPQFTGFVKECITIFNKNIRITKKE